ncbi:hypothetical protein PspLS_12044, partial [Pyricularia sp. CBS 133598]
MFHIAQQPAKIPQVLIEPPNILQNHNPTLLKRATFDNTCTNDDKATINLAATNCRSLAKHGTDAAKNNEKKILLYFKTSNFRSIRTIVKAFDKTYFKCNISSGEGIITCYNNWKACSEGTMAYTIHQKKKIIICPSFFTLPTTASSYGEKSQTNILLHEVTHLKSVKRTDDYLNWGHDDIL